VSANWQSFDGVNKLLIEYPTNQVLVMSSPQKNGMFKPVPPKCWSL